ncbi:MAG TPA: carbamoyltransferase HypF [Gemmatimonadales bacterium]|nr:carbamoyltransferase HypF [Gemmatimonadales bacterium]
MTLPAPVSASGSSAVALRLRVTGVVQGVGFRPFVHRLALREGVRGWVRNTAGAVDIHAEGEAAALEAFLAALSAEAPPLARLERVAREPAAPLGFAEFAIRVSAEAPGERQAVPPDVALCARCAAEMDDPADRRHRYPFITCTDCGPRWTVIEAMPYDRERTSMRAFRQCPECLREYRTPGNRRHHSETNSCAACGPSLWYETAGEPRDPPGPGRGEYEAAVESAAALLRSGGVLAVRGLGGFHLAVDATSPAAVARLRARKGREAKPVAVMAADLAAARGLAEVDEAAAALLRGAESPVVVLPLRRPSTLAPEVAPGLAEVGLMLPYTPLHRLLLAAAGRPLVMTSGNRSDEPIAIGVGEARRRLAGIADGFLLHDREIVSRYDDSVLRPAGAPIFLRRARGYAPLPLVLPVATPVPLVAVGPHLKNTFTLALGDRAWPSQHVGDLESVEALAHFEAALARYRDVFRIQPEVAVRDLHPGYLSSRVAEELGLGRVVAVQHHHAHLAAVLAEHGRTGPAVGLAFDGTGYGLDGTVWGGEILVGGLTGFARAGHLRPAPLPGGDAAARAPWRAVLGYLVLEPTAAGAFARAFDGVPDEERELAGVQAARRLNSPLHSSAGRLFDAAAAVLGLRRRSQYEGQAAMELEAMAGTAPGPELPFPLADVEGMLVLDPIPLLVALGERARAGEDRGALAAGFHDAVARGAVRAAAAAATAAGVGTVALGGGVFQNARLLVTVERELRAMGLVPLRPLRLGPNDGAVSYGQAAVAAAQLAAEAT